MSAPTDPSAWVAIAEEDLAVAKYALRRREVLTYVASFHAQQCAEKYLKAILVAKQMPFPKTHDFLMLSRICAEAGMTLGMDEDVLDQHPGGGPPPDEAREALEVAKTIRRIVRQWLGLR
jgi:HEPN domain-containing protein